MISGRPGFGTLQELIRVINGKHLHARVGEIHGFPLDYKQPKAIYIFNEGSQSQLDLKRLLESMEKEGTIDALDKYPICVI